MRIRYFWKKRRTFCTVGGYDDVQTEADPGRAMERIDRGAPYDAVLIDLDMQGLDGLWLMDAIHEADPDTECIVLSALNEARLAVDCIKKGAGDYLTKPVPDDRFLAAVKQAVGRLRRSRATFPPHPGTPASRRTRMPSSRSSPARTGCAGFSRRPGSTPRAT